MAIDYYLMGERLKKARVSKNITQEELAEKLNVSVAILSRVERGSSNFNLKRIEQVCNVLGITEAEIINGTSKNLAVLIAPEPVNAIVNSLSLYFSTNCSSTLHTVFFVSE